MIAPSKQSPSLVVDQRSIKTRPRAEAKGTKRLFYKPLSVEFRHDGFTVTDKDAAFAKLREIYRDAGQ